MPSKLITISVNTDDDTTDEELSDTAYEAFNVENTSVNAVEIQEVDW